MDRKEIQSYLLAQVGLKAEDVKDFLATEGEQGEEYSADGMVFINGVITGSAEMYRWFGIQAVSADDVRMQLAEIDGDVEMEVNSPGGSVFEASAIMSQLTARRKRKDRVKAVVTGLSASAAVPITMQADEIEIAPMAQFMIHSAWVTTTGNPDSLRSDADALEKINSSSAGIIAKRSGMDKEQVLEYMNSGEKWFSAEDAVENGMAERIYELSDEDVAEQEEEAPEQSSKSASTRMMRTLRVFERAAA